MIWIPLIFGWLCNNIKISLKKEIYVMHRFPFLCKTRNIILHERGINKMGIKQSELNWIRESVAAHQTTSCKLNGYANQVQDPQLKQMFTKASGDAKQAAQKLIQML